MTSIAISEPCTCELRQRAWNPNTGCCETCGARFKERAHVEPTTWDLIAAHVSRLREEQTLDAADAVMGLVLEDIRERRDGGRLPDMDHLGTAYGKLLDSCSCLMRALSAEGFDLAKIVTETAVPDSARRWYLRDIQQLCSSQIRMIVMLRSMIEEGDRRRASVEAAS